MSVGLGVRLATAIDELYQLYPKHLEPIAAKKAIAKAIQRLTTEREYRGENLPEIQVLAGLKTRVMQYAESRQGKKEFTPYPATWFNKGRYLEDPEEWYDDKTSKTEERVSKNRAAILAGLGISQQPGQSEPDIQNGVTARGGKSLAKFAG